ncbi:hypothetical protein L3Q82_003869 [Scortum barcoo]|uniref:Uncharacterized protein n=1 Tax=Scortum barcoo TaxID=214431 RepID=A0ACB8X6P0_9TELE|nr:hypothetical protein L3Q82_003869 [Scortum barcoo]
MSYSHLCSLKTSLGQPDVEATGFTLGTAAGLLADCIPEVAVPRSVSVILCSMDEHKGHDTVSAAAERTERQRELEVSRQNIQQRIQDKKKDVKELQQEVEAINSRVKELQEKLEQEDH